MLSRRMTIAAVVLLAAPAFGGAPALADDDGGDGRREARVSATCSSAARGELRLRSDDGEIRVEFELRRGRAGERWRVVVVHERRVAWRATLRTRGSNGALRVRRTIEDLDGPDAVTVRAAGPRGRTCEAAATLPA